MKSILIVRIGAMGDIIHALPGVASLRKTFPEARITWVVEPRWAGLLKGGGLVDRIVEFHRHEPQTWSATRAELRREKYDVAVDFQGSVKSALVARAAGPARLFGYGAGIARERPAAWFYSHPVRTQAKHVVDMGLDLAAAAGAAVRVESFPLPDGAPEGKLPDEPFVLASPLAGWTSKQWPVEYFGQLARMLRMPLVINGAPGVVPDIPGTLKHESGIAGLIDATRRAALVIGVDSGPLHLAAALGKPGIAIFGPTDPARNGPRGGDFAVFREAGAVTTHRRGTEIDVSMRAITPEMVLAALESRMPWRVVRRHWFPKPYADLVARLRVPAGFVMVVAFAVFSHPDSESMGWGIPLSMLGLALRAWAAGHLAKNERLAVSGPYAFTRNPLYLGTLITALGLAAAGRSAGLAVLFGALFLLVYLPAIELEEQHLSAILPGYAAFAQRVPLLLPRWPSGFGTWRFSFALYWKNREYEALLGWLAGVAWLAVRAWWDN